MKRATRSLAVGGLILTTLLAGCAGADLNADGTVNASITIAPATAAAVASASVNGMLADLLAGPVDTAMIDSLIVTVTRVDVLPDSLLHRCHPPEGDSLHGFRPGRPEGPGGPGGPGGGGPGGFGGPGGGCGLGGPGMGPFGPGGPGGHRDHPPRPDSLLPPDTGWGSRPSHWYSLDLVGSGRLDLRHLPAAGLTLASGTVPAGEYGGARLIVSDATIWFNTQVLSRDSVTLQPNTAYAVSLPRRRGGAMGIMTSAGFTIPASGGDVQLTFDANATMGRVIVVDSGKVVLAPVLHPR